MGKQKRVRQKYHATITGTQKKTSEPSPLEGISTENESFNISDDLFKGLAFNIKDLNNKLNEDVVSVKSFKSVKSEIAGTASLSKKDKLKLRRQLLLRKIDTINQLKKENKSKRRKTKKQPNEENDGGDEINILNDALPSLQSLLVKQKESKEMKATTKSRPIEKAKKRKSDMLKGIRLYKKIMQSDDFKKNPLEVISEHVKRIVEKRE